MNIDITSPSNPKIKWLRSLHSNSTRRREAVFLVEGAKEIAMALDGGYTPHSLYICPELYNEELAIEEAMHIYTISKDCFEKASYRSGSDGLLAVFQAAKRTVDDLDLSENPLLLVVESVEKPGNLGAMIRTADGAGVDAVIVCDERTDIFNPNVIRSSVGTLFTKQVVAAKSEDVYDFLERHEITAYGAILSKDSKLYTETDLSAPTALLLGTEHEGLTDFWKERAQPIIIPMNGSNDSLNVSNAAAILVYEALRQRS